MCIIIPELIATSFTTPTAMKLIAHPPSSVPNPPIPCIGIIDVIKKNVDASRKGASVMPIPIDSSCAYKAK